MSFITLISLVFYISHSGDLSKMPTPHGLGRRVLVTLARRIRQVVIPCFIVIQHGISTFLLVSKNFLELEIYVFYVFYIRTSR